MDRPMAATRLQHRERLAVSKRQFLVVLSIFLFVARNQKMIFITATISLGSELASTEYTNN